jgi:hypothetical protein
VHAKLVAVITGTKALLLSGSANLSRAALTSSVAGEPWANIEAGVLNELTADSARELFQPPDLAFREISLDSLREISFDGSEETPSSPLRLLWALPDDAGRVEVSIGGEIPAPISLTSRSATVPMDARLWQALVAFAGDPELASDAVAETFAQALRRGEAMRDPARWVSRAAFKTPTHRRAYDAPGVGSPSTAWPRSRPRSRSCTSRRACRSI